jgi:hypothetical protein
MYDVVGWFLGCQKNTRAAYCFCEKLLLFFLSPLTRNIQKRDKQKSREKLFFFRVDFCVFDSQNRHHLFVEIFVMAFLEPT